MFPGSGCGGDDGVKRELIESCPDFSGILDQENDDKLGQGQRYSSMGEFISEKEEAGKEEIKNIMSKVDQRKNRRQSQKKNESNDDDDEEEEEEEHYNGNSGDGVDWREIGRKKKSSHPFRCPDNNCGETFAKEVKKLFLFLYFGVIYIFILRWPRFHIFFSIIRMNMQRLVIESNIKRLLIIRC